MQINVNQVVGAVLRHYRNRRKITSADVAILAKVSRAMYSRYENGHTTVPTDVLYRIATKLHVKRSRFFRRIERTTDMLAEQFSIIVVDTCEPDVSLNKLIRCVAQRDLNVH